MRLIALQAQCQGIISLPPPPPRLIPILRRGHFSGGGGGGIFSGGGGGVIFEAPRGRNFIPPPPLLYAPHPYKRIFRGGGGGLYKIWPRANAVEMSIFGVSPVLSPFVQLTNPEKLCYSLPVLSRLGHQAML